ncbi:MAG: type II secretion system protein [Clostridia bacterium]|nr:type II secretion system protein [Clostridia bacterium]
MLKNRRGLSLTTMVVTVLIMLLIMGTLVYSAVDSVKVRKLNKFYNDLRQLDDAVEMYYLKYGQLPVDTTETAIVAAKNNTKESLDKVDFVLAEGATKVVDQNSFFNPNDYDVNAEKATYQYINLDLLENISLNYMDTYIVNEQSHTVYNYTGMTVDKVTYHVLPLTYRYTQYKETNPVGKIRLKAVPGMTNANTKDFYFSYNTTEPISLRDYLEFDVSTTNSAAGNDGLGTPKKVTFSTEASPYYTLTPEGVLTRKAGIVNVDDAEGNYKKSVTVTATSYKESVPERTYTFFINTDSINVYTISDTPVEVNEINLVTQHTTSSIYTTGKTQSEEYSVHKNGYLTKQNPDMKIETEDSEIATATYNKTDATKKVIFRSGTKAGTVNITLTSDGYGYASDTVKVNVYNFEIYAGAGATLASTNKIDFADTGATNKITVRLNVEGPTLEFDSAHPKNTVTWEIIGSDGTTPDTSNSIVKLTSTTEAKKIELERVSSGKVYLKCTVKVDDEVFQTMLVPIVTYDTQSNDNSQTYTASSDTITVTKAVASGNGVKIKFAFGDTVTSASYEATTATTGFTITPTGSSTSNEFVVKYSGTNAATGIITVTATVGDKKYTDTINIAVTD